MSISWGLERTIYYVPQHWPKLSQTFRSAMVAWTPRGTLFAIVLRRNTLLIAPDISLRSEASGKNVGEAFGITWVVEVKEVTNCHYIPYSTLSHAFGYYFNQMNTCKGDFVNVLANERSREANREG